jgi:WD40 repeat protein
LYGAAVVDLWDGASNWRHRCFKTDLTFGAAVAFSPDSKTLAIGGQAAEGSRRISRVEIWDVSKQERRRELFVGKTSRRLQGVISLAYSGDGEMLAVSVMDYLAGNGEVELWQTDTGSLRGKIPVSQWPKAVAFAPDRNVLIIATCDESNPATPGAVEIWDVKSVKLKATLGGHVAGVAAIAAIAFSPDGTLLASGSRHGFVKLWDAVGGGELREVKCDAGDVHSLAFSPDGTRIAVGCGRVLSVKAGMLGPTFKTEGTVKLLETATLQTVSCFKAYDGIVDHILFGCDGNSLVTGSILERGIMIWNLTSCPGSTNLE